MYKYMDDTTIKERFGAFLKAERIKRKMTQVELAELVGISNQRLSNYEKGQKMPGYANFIRINEALGRDPGRTLMKIAHPTK